MTVVEQLITENLDVWSSVVKTKASGRGRSKKIDLYGVKKLRELILELAVRGLIVSQNTDDEPASDLLNKIAAKKEQLIQDKKIKKPKKLLAICEEEKPFKLPHGWKWVRFQDICSYIQRGKGPKYDDIGQVRVVSQKCIQWDGFTLEPARHVSDTSLGAYQEERYLQSNDLLWNSTGTGTVGRINILDAVESKSLVADSHVTVIRTLMVDSGFICSYIAAPGIQSRIEPDNENALVSGSTKQVELNTSSVMNLEIPIPPKAEQQRIVAKVDELMALCDQLEQQQENSISTHQTLVETLLAALTNAGEKGEFNQAWARIAEHFDTLFTTEHSIDQLKQTILQLAVMGKLVPQDPNDEPASVLLEKIAAEKAQLVKDGKIKKQKVLPEIGEDEKPFELPEGWEWRKFGLVAEFINGDRGKNYPNRSEYVDSGKPWINTGHIEPNGTLTETGMNFITDEKFESLRGGKIQDGDLVYCLRGATFGKTAFVNPYSEGAIASSLMIIRPFFTELNSYIFRYLVSPFGRSQIFRFDNGSAQPNLSANSVMLYAFPVPPFNEQRRIDEKIEELMCLCDSLKACINESQTTQLHLADAMTEQALQR